VGEGRGDTGARDWTEAAGGEPYAGVGPDRPVTAGEDAASRNGRVEPGIPDVPGPTDVSHSDEAATAAGEATPVGEGERAPVEEEPEPAAGPGVAAEGAAASVVPVLNGPELNGSEPAPPPKPLPTGRIIALANQKGGVGKTTTAINLGAALVEHGAKVLLVDFDPQGALSVGLGFNPHELEVTVYNVLLEASMSYREAVLRTKFEGLDLLPSNIDLAAAEIMLVQEVAREQMLKRALTPAQDVYNYILIDCPPSLGLLTVNALTAADGVLIPLECEYFALRGMALLLDTIDKVRQRLNPSLQVQGILATMLDRRTLHAREVLSRVSDAFGDKLFRTLVHKTIRFAEAPVAGEPILTYAPKSPGAEEYRNLAREVMSR
jgi:chromosome partitioning protein